MPPIREASSAFAMPTKNRSLLGEALEVIKSCGKGLWSTCSWLSASGERSRAAWPDARRANFNDARHLSASALRPYGSLRRCQQIHRARKHFSAQAITTSQLQGGLRQAGPFSGHANVAQGPDRLSEVRTSSRYHAVNCVCAMIDRRMAHRRGEDLTHVGSVQRASAPEMLGFASPIRLAASG